MWKTENCLVLADIGIKVSVVHPGALSLYQQRMPDILFSENLKILGILNTRVSLHRGESELSRGTFGGRDGKRFDR